MTFLDGKVVIITGAGRGLGAAYAMAAAEAGAAVMVNDVDTDAAARTVQSITTRGGQAIADAADIATWSGVGSLVDHCVDAFGRIDGLVNNAGLYRLTASRVVRTSHPFSLCPQSTSRARCTAAFTRCVTCLLIEPVPSSTSPQAPQPGSPGEHFMARPRPPCSRSPGPGRSIVADRDVRVNAISPLAATAMGDTLRSFYAGKNVPDISHVTPDSNAPVVVYLLSELSADLNGQIIRINDGELSIMHPPAAALPTLRRIWDVPSVAEALAGELGRAIVPLPAIPTSSCPPPGPASEHSAGPGALPTCAGHVLLRPHHRDRVRHRPDRFLLPVVLRDLTRPAADHDQSGSVVAHLAPDPRGGKLLHQRAGRQPGQIVPLLRSERCREVLWVDWRLSTWGSPEIAGCLAWLHCEIEQEIDAGDHTIVVCRLRDVDLPDDDTRAPLLFHRSRFLTLAIRN